jgi:glycolate oxidase FAD binding subunit
LIEAAASIGEIQEAVRGAQPGVRLLPVGSGSKPALSGSARDDVELLDVSGLSGIVEYDPTELTLTALAGTPIAEIEAALAEHGQYLPFDPPLAGAGATLGGTLAAGASGPGAWRYGGIRDFVIGVRFVDGAGRLITGGGKVVKNAAGFDLAKLMVGSIGRLGVIVQVSCKVFPTAPASVTLEFACERTDRALAAVTALARGRVELDALEVFPGGRVFARLTGRADTLAARCARVVELAGAEARPYQGEDERTLWHEAREFGWLKDGGTLVRVGLSLRQVRELETAVASSAPEAAVRFGIAGTVAWIGLPAGAELDALDSCLRALGLPGMVLLGAPDRPLLGPSVSGGPFGARIVRALDPHSRFLEL